MHSTYLPTYLSLYPYLSNLIISFKLVRHALLEAVVITQLYQNSFLLILCSFIAISIYTLAMQRPPEFHNGSPQAFNLQKARVYIHRCSLNDVVDTETEIRTERERARESERVQRRFRSRDKNLLAHSTRAINPHELKFPCFSQIFRFQRKRSSKIAFGLLL